MTPFDLKEEHKTIRKKLAEIKASAELEYVNYNYLKRIFTELHDFWNTHEKNEELFLERLGKHKEVNTMILDQHKELKGHWIVISKAIKSKNDQSMKATLDTDGKMLVEKLTKHIEEEEKILKIK